MALKDAYKAELARKLAAEESARAPHEQARERLRAFYQEIRDDRELMDEIQAEVELFDDELRIDPGPVMITVQVTPSGDFKMNYEVKRANDYAVTEVPVRSIEDIELALAKLLVDGSVG